MLMRKLIKRGGAGSITKTVSAERCRKNKKVLTQLSVWNVVKDHDGLASMKVKDRSIKDE
jgi:hypothetical protein